MMLVGDFFDVRVWSLMLRCMSGVRKLHKMCSRAAWGTQ